MSWIKALCVVGGIALLSPVANAASDDASTITTCLREMEQSQKDAHACIGRVSDPCSETPEGQSTPGTVACTMRETEVWDKLLNEEYKRLLALVGAETANDVRKAQRIWLTARDADCRVPYQFYNGGTIVQILGAQCERDHTANRAILIKSWRGMAEGKE
ncbi:hypothetical protein APY04_0332 [Hyphomicrobium sulfonivorans]|uniref:Lysozyme inhibitor LprI-like N-terminal domain-containing protein n=1 Tax=Hyphomicrobium sulfonivorans TaxID=121290 RepID=A0A109BNG1_HYPSL|nr:lysozyme inhibitor LprI family protein [Hyphomicrobium sulfonivorans]KWT72049.1 hypothetical protein APY04_0332 [Hyphomicrobium sulfonivorans]